jgi:hypothetical protein
MSKLDNIIEYAKANPRLPAPYLAKKFGVHISTAHRGRSLAGVTKGKSIIPATNLKYDRVKSFMQERPEANAREVAAATGCTESYVYLLMKAPKGKLYRELNKLKPISTTSVLPVPRVAEPTEEPMPEQPEVEVADTNFLAYGKWMTRQELIGYLKGSAVSTLTQGTFTKADLKTVGWKIIKLSELVTD